MEFPPLHIHPPQGPHTHTAILLHGRGSNGPEFAEELFSSTTSQNQNLPSHLPTYRWVFPTSRHRWSTTLEEDLCAWFDAYSVDDIHARQELQTDGIRESVLYILDILDDEVLLGGQYSRIFLGGISQGMATALWAFFGAVGTGRVRGALGGLLGFCGWLPFAQQLDDLLLSGEHDVGTTQTLRLVSQFFVDTIAGPAVPRDKTPVDCSVLSTPVFLSHGTDDEWVSVQLGRQASRIFRQIVVRVEWDEFTGAEGDGHWIKEPEGFDQTLRFLEAPGRPGSEAAAST